MTVPRRDRRRQLCLIGVLPALLLLLCSARIVLVLVHDADGRAAYSGEQYDDAQGRFADNRLLNPVERWVAPFNEGDAQYRLANFAAAASSFDAALRHAPAEHRCSVRTNLALSHEGIGDAANAEDNSSVAREAWLRGREELTPCLNSAEASTSGKGDAQAPHVMPAIERAVGVVHARLHAKLEESAQGVARRALKSPPPLAADLNEATLVERNRHALSERRLVRGHARGRLTDQTSGPGNFRPPW